MLLTELMNYRRSMVWKRRPGAKTTWPGLALASVYKLSTSCGWKMPGRLQANMAALPGGSVRRNTAQSPRPISSASG